MKTVQLTALHEIELSSVCNLACRYCPHPKLQREKAHMSWDTFERTLEQLEWFCKRGTQGEVSLTGIGEAILHPRFVEALGFVRACIGRGRDLVMATNGVAITKELAKVLYEHGVIVYVSTHRPEKAGPAFEMLAMAGCILGKNDSFVDKAFNWAGQVKWHVSAAATPCEYLKQGWGVVRQDGFITSCCLDAHALFPIGHVDDDFGSLRTHIIPLCASCHMTVPNHLIEAELPLPAVHVGSPLGALQ